MRKDWEYKKLGEVAISDLGKTLNKSKDTGTLYPYLCAINILWDKIDLSTLKETRFEDDELERYTVKYGDLLVCEGGDTGRAAIWDKQETMLYQNALHRIRLNNEINSRFLLYYLWQLKLNGEIDAKYSKGVTIKHLVKSSLMSIPTPLPPKPTQLAIVAELDKINELIQLKKQQLKDYDQLAQSIFYEMFGDPVENEKGWEVKKLGDICEVTSAKRVFIEEVVDSGVPFIRGTELTALNRLTRGEKMKYSLFITKEHYERLKAITGVPKYGDLLIPSINSEGIAWIVNTEEPLYFKDGRVLWVHVNQDVFKSECLQKIMNILLKHTYKSMGGATFSELKLFVLRELKVPIPPIESQQQFAARIEAIERQKQQVSETIKDLETLLASRMQYWFD